MNTNKNETEKTIKTEKTENENKQSQTKTGTKMSSHISDLSFINKLIIALLDNNKTIIEIIQQEILRSGGELPTQMKELLPAVMPAVPSGVATQLASTTVVTPTEQITPKVKIKSSGKPKVTRPEKPSQPLIKFPNGGTSNVNEYDVLDETVPMSFFNEKKPRKLEVIIERDVTSGNTDRLVMHSFTNKGTTWTALVTKLLRCINYSKAARYFDPGELMFPERRHRKTGNLTHPARPLFHSIGGAQVTTYTVPSGSTLQSVNDVDGKSIVCPTICTYDRDGKTHRYAFSATIKTERKIEMMRIMLKKVRELGVDVMALLTVE